MSLQDPRDQRRRSLLLGVFYWLGLAYVAVYPLHFVRAYWDYLWPRFPLLPEQLFPGTSSLLAISVIVAMPLGALFVAALRRRDGWRGWLEALLLWAALSLLLLGLVVVQLLFIDSLLPRLDPRALPIGVAIGVVGWRLLGGYLLRVAGWLRAGAGLAAAQLRSGWHGRAAVAVAIWLLWLVSGRWGWQLADGQAWFPGPWAWLWGMSWLAGLVVVSGRWSHSAPVAQRLAGALLSWLALSLGGLLLLMVAAWLQLGRPQSIALDELLGQQGGIVLGMVLGLLSVALLRSADISRLGVLRRLPGVLALVLIGIALLPLDGDTRIIAWWQAWLPSRPTAIPQALWQQLYQLIKAAMLWVPVGFLFSLGGQQRLMWSWFSALFGGLLLVIAPWLQDWPIALLSGIGGAVAGLSVGCWLAAGSRLSLLPGLVAVGRGDAAEKLQPLPAVLSEPELLSAHTSDQPSATSVAFRRRDAASLADTPRRAGWRERREAAEPKLATRPAGFRSRVPPTAGMPDSDDGRDGG